MGGIGGGWCERHRGGTGDEHRACITTVADTHTLDLDVVVGRNGDVGLYFDLAIAAVKRGNPVRECCLVRVRPLPRQLQRG